MYDNLNDVSKNSDRQFAGYITLLQVIIIEFNFLFFSSLMLILIFFCFENMCSVGFMSIFILVLMLLLLKIIMRGNRVPTAGTLEGITNVNVSEASR